MPQGQGHFVGQLECLTRGSLDLVRPTQPDVHQGCPIAQGYPGRIRVIKLANPAQIGLDGRGRLVWEAQMPESPCLIVGSRGAGILSKAMEHIAMNSRIIGIERLSRECERFPEATLIEQFQRQHSITDEAWSRLRLHLGERHKALGEFSRSPACDMESGPLSPECWKLRRHVTNPFGKHQSTLKCPQGRWRGVSLVRDQRLPQLQL